MNGAALAEVERRLHGRLRAHHLSSQLIDRHVEDAVQKGVVEWLRAESTGTEVRDPKAFVIEAAFRRAIDEVRREARRADGATLDGLLETGNPASPSAEDVAIESLESMQLRAAIDSLPAEQRQVLALHYFGDLDQRRAAELLYMSERTFRRRLKETLASLGKLLGAPAPEQSSLKGLEIGLAAWAGLGGGRLVGSSGLGAPLYAFLDSVRQAPGKIIDRLRGSATSLVASETPERVGAITGGPAGKVIGGCAGAAVVCALSGVIGPGLNLGGDGAHAPAQHARRAISSGHPITGHRNQVFPHRQAADGPVGLASSQSTNASVSPSSSKPARRGGSSDGPRSATGKKAHRKTPPTEAGVTEEEFSGISQAASESDSTSSEVEVESGSIQQTAPAEAQAPAESTQSPESSGGASQRNQAESEFGFEK